MSWGALSRLRATSRPCRVTGLLAGSDGYKANCMSRSDRRRKTKSLTFALLMSMPMTGTSTEEMPPKELKAQPTADENAALVEWLAARVKEESPIPRRSARSSFIDPPDLR
jgi:hypothetical protein